jgi:hypothetical protein
MAETTAHYFAFSSTFRNGERVCRECDRSYARGDHLVVDRLKPRTKYVCPSGGGLGHSGMYTGALDAHPELRRPDEHLCICGEEFVEEDTETWQLTFEMRTPLDPEWHTVKVVRSRHASEQQRLGLIALAEQGEPIRNVNLVRLDRG